MSGLVTSLYTIKSDIQRKRLFRQGTFALPSDLPKEDLDKVSKDLSKKIIIERTELSHLIKQQDENIQRYMEEVRQRRKKKEEAEQKLLKFNEKDIERDITKHFDRILKALPIEHIEFVQQAVTIFTTSVLKKHNKIMGSYRIWIDWNCAVHSDAIKVVNIHHEAGNHPHPCVGSSANICEGNASVTFRKYYDEKNIYDLVESIIGFLLSEDVTNGYITSWDRWFEQLNVVDPKTVFSRRGIRPIIR